MCGGVGLRDIFNDNLETAGPLVVDLAIGVLVIEPVEELQVFVLGEEAAKGILHLGELKKIVGLHLISHGDP